MADIYDEFLTYLKAQASVTTLVGSGDDARIFPDVPRQSAVLPFVVIVEVGGGQSFQHLGGISGVAETAFQVYAYDDARGDANDLSETIRLAGPLQGFKGLFGSTAVQGVVAVNHRDAGVDLMQDKSDQKRYWNRRTYRVFHTESTS